jgi:hypothetical protein
LKKKETPFNGETHVHRSLYYIWRGPLTTQAIFCRQWIPVFLVFIGISLAVFPVSATIFAEDGSNRTVSDLYELTNSTNPGDLNGSAVLFYNPDCESCSPAHEFLEKYILDHPDTEIEIVNVSNGTTEMDRFNDFQTKFHREKVFVPALYIGAVGMEGSQTIIANFEGLYGWYHQVPSID